jgi:hypothetical protein
MGYVIAGILVLLLVTGFVTFLVLNSMRKGGSAARGDAATPGVGGDSTPLGDTTEHAGEQTEQGTTSSDPESNAGEDEAARGFDPEQPSGAGDDAEADDPARPARPEARQQRDAGAANPGPERLADRPR